MPGYVVDAMVMTPWGDAGSLRERRLPPGRGRPRSEVERNQRERLYAAMVAICARKDYTDVSVANLAELSGVSSRSFYGLFRDKEECLLATMEEILGAVEATTRRALGAERASGWQARVAVETFVAVVAAQPAAARLCLVTALCAGEGSRARMDDAINRFGTTIAAALEEIPGHAGMPAALSEAILGGIAIMLYRRLASTELGGIAQMAPALEGWALGVPSPPGPLRSRARGTRMRAAAEPALFAAHVPAERILRALAGLIAEKGYTATTIADVAARAQISQNTFYKHFRDKRNAFDAALEAGSAQFLAATVPAIRRHGRWPGAVRTGLEAACAWLTAERDYAHLLAVEAYAVGPQAVQRRDASLREIMTALAEIAPADTALEPLAMEVNSGAAQALAYRRVRAREFDALAEIPTLITYLLLAPQLGDEAAYEVAVR